MSSIRIKSIETTCMENVSIGILDEYIEHYLGCKDKAEKSCDVLRNIQFHISYFFYFVVVDDHDADCSDIWSFTQPISRLQGFMWSHEKAVLSDIIKRLRTYVAFCHIGGNYISCCKTVTSIGAPAPVPSLHTLSPTLPLATKAKIRWSCRILVIES